MRNLLQSFFDQYKAAPHWDVERMGRHKVLLPQILESVEGDILEIGAHCGTSTRMFCEIAEKFGRKVYVIDPWDGRQEGDGEVYKTFVNNTAEFKNLVVTKMGSERPEALQAVKHAKFAFIFIDGLHSYDGVASDFTRYRTLLSVRGVICVDDWTGPYDFCFQIRLGILDHMSEEYAEIHSPGSLIERYIARI